MKHLRPSVLPALGGKVDADADDLDTQDDSCAYKIASEDFMMQPANDARFRDITAWIVAALAPERVLLFGSYAWGSPHAESDLYHYIIVPDQTEPPYRLARRAYQALHGVRMRSTAVARSHTSWKLPPPVGSLSFPYV